MSAPDDPTVPLIEGAALDQRLSPAAAVACLESAVLAGLDVEADLPRMFAPLQAGEFLLMPAENRTHAGIKVVTIAPANPARGLDRIHAWYLLFDAATLRPLAVVDGTRLTLIRTAAVTTLAVRELLRAAPGTPVTAIEHLAVLGTGPQAEAHVRTLAAVLPLGRVSLIGRTPARTAARAEALGDLGIRVDVADRDALARADVVIAVTSSSDPVLSRADVGDEAVIAAVGSHGPERRELSADLVLDADLVVEARASALRENGNLLGARPRSEWDDIALSNLSDLVGGRIARRAGHPAVYTGVGMSWEDLAVVAALVS